MSGEKPKLPDGVRIVSGAAIEGVKVIPLRRIPDERGTILHVMSSKDPWFEQLRRDLLLDRLRGRRSRAGTSIAR